MAFLEYEGVGITAMAAAVPRTVIKNYEYTQYFPAEEVKEVVDKVTSGGLLMKILVLQICVLLRQKS